MKIHATAVYHVFLQEKNMVESVVGAVQFHLIVTEVFTLQDPAQRISSMLENIEV